MAEIDQALIDAMAGDELEVDALEFQPSMPEVCWPFWWAREPGDYSLL